MIKSNIKQHVVPRSYLKRFGKKNLNNKGSNIAVKQLKENENKNYFQVNDDGSMLPWYCNISILQR